MQLGSTYSRRTALKAGLFGLSGLTLADLFRANTVGASTRNSNQKSVILIWLDGGPSHFETFDPKPDAPAEIRGEFHTISTKIPGVFFSENMVRLAAISEKLSIVRSVRDDQNNHGAGNHYMMTGAPTRIPVGCGAFVSFHPSMGSVVSAERGAPPGLPPYFSMPEMTRSGGPNFLGAQYAPFVVPDDPNKDDFRVRDVAIPRELESARFDSRKDLRGIVDKLERISDPAAADPVTVLDDYYQQSYSLISSPEAQKAFDIHSETAEVRDAYGRHDFGQRAFLKIAHQHGLAVGAFEFVHDLVQHRP